MNYKKLALTLLAFVLLGSAAFAEVSVKDMGKDGVAITFTFKDSSSEMGVIGSFDNWTVPGEPMTKNAAGLWEKTIMATATDEITYKFYSKGTWIQDEMAPDHKDDGYGGKNGLIVVADILSGAVSATPGAAPVVVVAGPKKPAGRPKMAFGTQTFIESDTAIDTDGGSFAGLNSVVNSYSQWKFDGDLIAGMPGHLEITAFKGKSTILDNGSTPLDAGTGSQNLAGGVLFSPFYYLGGNSQPVIDKFRFGVDTPYLVYDTGYGNTTFPARKTVLWDTVSLSTEQKYGSTRLGTISTSSVTRYGGTPLTAGNGYSSFVMGPKAKSWGDFTLDAGAVPNFSNSGSFGLQTWASVDYQGAVRAEIQYEMQAALNSDGSIKTDASKFFDKPYIQNTLIGLETYFLDGFQVKAQVLIPQFVPKTTLDKLNLSDKMAGKVVVGYSDVYKDSEVLLSWSYRGGYNNSLFGRIDPTSQLLFLNAADNNSVLGTPMSQSFGIDGFQNFGYVATAKLNASATMATDTKISENIATRVRPGFVLNLDKLELAPLSIELYGQTLLNSKPATGVDATGWDIAGAKLAFGELVPGVIKGMDVYYRADNTVKNALFNTVLTEIEVAGGVDAQAGLGVRSGTATKNALGFSLGASYQVPVPDLRLPTVYSQFVYNMDPYNASATAGAVGYDLNDFGPVNGVSSYDGLGALRVGVSWNF